MDMRQTDADEVGQRDHHVFESRRLDLHLAPNSLELSTDNRRFFHDFLGLPVGGEHVNTLLMGGCGQDKALHVTVGYGEGYGSAACGLAGRVVAIADGGKLAVEALRVIALSTEDALKVLFRQIGEQHATEDVCQSLLRLALSVSVPVALCHVGIDTMLDENVESLHWVALTQTERIPPAVF